jgi:NAD(P)-dependent dehydrogenase (short-subunit alcohol dehydrogenase family)
MGGRIGTGREYGAALARELAGHGATCKHKLPLMRDQHCGVIVNISSVAAVVKYPYVAYKTSNAGVVALTQQIAANEAKYGLRANAILPGLMNTPMAIAPIRTRVGPPLVGCRHGCGEDERVVRSRIGRGHSSVGK